MSDKDAIRLSNLLRPVEILKRHKYMMQKRQVNKNKRHPEKHLPISEAAAAATSDCIFDLQRRIPD